MADSLYTNHYKMEKLVRWEHVNEVNEMLLGGTSPHKVSIWCKQHGLSISGGKLYEYKEMLQTASAQQITVERLLGIGAPKRTPVLLQSLGLTNSKEMVKTEMEVLDLIIQKGYSSILNSAEVTTADAMRAIELKNKLTGGAHGGLTGAGLDQLRELEGTKFNAAIQVMLRYVPQDKWNEIQEEIAKSEREFYETQAPELLEQYDKNMQEQIDGIKSSIIVQDTEYEG